MRLGTTAVVVLFGAFGAAALACSSAASDAGGATGGEPAKTRDKPPVPDPPPDDPPADSVDPVLGPSADACVGAPGSIYALTVRRLSSTEDFPMCRFEGKVLLVVNTASHCGYTPEYEPLESLWAEYKTQGLYVLGFPSGTFNQEFEDEADVSSFCATTYHITFPLFAIGNVNPPDEQPLYTWLKSQPGQSTDVAWNFEKFLVGRDGKVAGRFLSAVQPDDPTVKAAIEAELAKPPPPAL
jgi:glutathione peroxidase